MKRDGTSTEPKRPAGTLDAGDQLTSPHKLPDAPGEVEQVPPQEVDVAGEPESPDVVGPDLNTEVPPEPEQNTPRRRSR